MGPIPQAGMTLDRIDHKNPKYGPGFCRWATKKTQSMNRKSVTLISADGVAKSVSEWAKELGVTTKKLLRRRSDGWTDSEIIAGIRDRDLEELGWPPGYGYKLEPQYFSDLTEGRVSLDASRMQWLHDRAKARCEGLRYYFENNVDPNEPHDEKDRDLAREYDRCEYLLRYAAGQLREQAQRNAIIHRSGGLGRAIERRAYDAFTRAHRSRRSQQ